MKATVKKSSKKSVATAKKTTKKKIAKKAANKVAKTTEKKTAEKKTGINKSQAAILQVLAKTKKPLTRSQIVAKGVEATSFGGYAGLIDPNKRAALEARSGRKSLLDAKLVSCEQHDVDGKDTILWSLTALGRKAVASL